MKITGALVSVSALLVLGSMPQFAHAQCGAAYWDYHINEEQDTVEAWTYVQEYFLPECPWAEAYQYGYFEHQYTTSISIGSPLGQSAYDDDYQVMPYGGGGASAFASISYIGDPGVFTFHPLIVIYCTIGGLLGLLDIDDFIDALPGFVFVRLTFDDGPRVTSINRTYEVLAALAVNNAQTPILATFFVQTHAPTHGGDEVGLDALEAEHTAFHSLMIHTGSPGDHTFHTVRLATAAYDANEDGMLDALDGATALDGDLIRAKARIASIQGSDPKYVRAPGYVLSDDVLLTYTAHGLTHSRDDVDSGDTYVSPLTVENIKGELAEGLEREIGQGDRDIVILFHDVNPITGDTDNMRELIDHIKSELQELGYFPLFIRM